MKILKSEVKGIQRSIETKDFEIKEIQALGSEMLSKHISDQRKLEQQYTHWTQRKLRYEIEQADRLKFIDGEMQ